MKDGLPHPSVRWLAQTPDRLLWVGTALGLARFDGARFKVFDPTSTPALGDARIKTLCVDPDGALWVLGENGDVVRRGTASAGATEVIEGLDDLVVFNFLGSTVANGAGQFIFLDNASALTRRFYRARLPAL